MEWQPIETAPKDGTAMLGYWASLAETPHERSVAVTKFQNGVWRNVDDEDDEYIDPTHWMPLPPPPNGGQDDRQTDA